MQCLALLAALLMVAPAAQAHSSTGTLPVLFGMVHVVVSPLSVLAIIGLGSALAHAHDRATAGAVVTAGLVAACASALLPASWVRTAPIGVIAAGLTAALLPRPPVLVSQLVGAAAGFSVGIAAAPDEPGLLVSLGVGLVTLVLLEGLAQGYLIVNRYVPLARRVVGAWMAAIALLLGALALSRP